MEKNQKVEAAMQKVESHQSELAAKDHLIQNLHQDLYQIEPERERRLNKHSNRTIYWCRYRSRWMDENQKQLVDMEQKVEESDQKVTNLMRDLDKSCRVVQTLAKEVHARDKEIANLKMELKRKEKKV